MLTLLLALRGLALDRDAADVVTRTHRQIAGVLLFMLAVGALVYYAPQLNVCSDTTAMLLAGAGLILLIAGIWLIVGFFRLLAALLDALRSPPRGSETSGA